MADASQLHRQVRKRIRSFRKSLPGLQQGDLEALHRARIASRRLRELIPLLGAEAPESRRALRRLERVTKRLGKVRELDVLADLIEELQQQDRYSSAALQKVNVEVAACRASARRHLADALPTEKLEQTAAKLKRLARPRKANGATNIERPTGTVQWILDARLARRAAELRDAVESAGTLYAPEPLHVVRLAIKKLRYCLEAKADLNRRRMTRSVAVLAAGQESLGRLHD